MNNIIIPNMFPESGCADPHVLVDGGKVYIFCGHDQSWEDHDTWVMDKWIVWSSEDLRTWKKETEILPAQTYIGNKPHCWAGDPAKRNGKYYWYFSNKNIDTGVMTADSPAGPWKDALGRPLLPKDIIEGNPYDPDIYEEDDRHHIIFGAGVYYAAELAEDMVSLKTEPQALSVVDKKGDPVKTDDKPSVFRRNGRYYLAFGNKYAMGDNLYGPYVMEGPFLENNDAIGGGHNNVFRFKGQDYVVTENKDISIFYRGLTLLSLHFNEDGTVKVNENDVYYPTGGRVWDFKRNLMGFKAVSGTTLEWRETGGIGGTLFRENKTATAAIESAAWGLTDLDRYGTLRFSLKNGTEATQARVSVASVTGEEEGFWTHPDSDWSREATFLIEIQPKSAGFVDYEIDLKRETYLKRYLKRLRIEPALDTERGTWEIRNISVS